MKKMLFTIALLATGLVQAAGNRAQVTTQAEFDAAIKSKPVAFVLISAKWCPHCTQIKPVVDQLMQEHPNVMFVHIDADSRALADKYAKAYPTIMVYKNGSLATTHAGTMPRAQLKALIS
jgi:thiol-disulfide isomerase/thioredoxin